MDKKLDFSLLKKLTELGGISGRETQVAAFLKSQLSRCADSITTDTLGNLIVYKKGTSAKNLLLCAHMDEVGLMVRFIDEGGFLRFTTVGGIDPRTLLAQRVHLHTKEGILPGVIGTKPAHITTLADRAAAIPVSDLFIDVGLPAVEVKKYVEVGDWAVLDRPYSEMSGGIVCAKALDNRAGVFILAELLRLMKNPFYNIYGVFTVQEEVGARGAATAAYGVKADISLCLDTTGAADIPSVRPQDYIVRLGGGVGITALDARSITPVGLLEALKEICRTNRIPYQVRVAPRGGTDAGAVHLSKTGVLSCGLSLPTRNIHSNVEMVAKRDIEAMFALTACVAKEGVLL